MWKWFIIPLVLILTACGNTVLGNGNNNAAPAGSGLMQVDEVEVLIAESFPPQVFVNINGVLGDACTSLGEITQQRDGNRITVTITTNHTGDEVCAQVAQLIEERVLLDGTFDTGEYTVSVNGVERTFQV